VRSTGLASTGDGFVLPLLAAIIIGRIGCQLSGLPDLTYGNATVCRGAGNYGDGVARHPTALYEILGVAAIASVLYGAHFMTRQGDRFRTFMGGTSHFALDWSFLKPHRLGPAAEGFL